MTDKDDVSTIVLDFNNLKTKLDEKEDIIEDEATFQNLAFSTDLLKNGSGDTNITSLKELKISRKIFLLNYKTKFFEKHHDFFSDLSNSQSLSSIKDLNSAITDFPNGIFIMYFNDNPKVINQISEQIKNKFTKAISIIIAKNLSVTKAKEHKKSKYGANAYLNEPFLVEELEEILSEFI